MEWNVVAKFEVRISTGSVPKDGDRHVIEIPDDELEDGECLLPEDRENIIQQYLWDEIVDRIIRWDYKEIKQ